MASIARSPHPRERRMIVDDLVKKLVDGLRRSFHFDEHSFGGVLHVTVEPKPMRQVI